MKYGLSVMRRVGYGFSLMCVNGAREVSCTLLGQVGFCCVWHIESWLESVVVRGLIATMSNRCFYKVEFSSGVA